MIESPRSISSPPFDPQVARAYLIDRDPRLGRWIDQVGPCRLEWQSAQSPYEALLEAIVYQQLTGKAAATIFGRLCALFDAGRAPRPGELAATPEERLRAVGLSRAKALAVKDLAAKARSGRVPTRGRMERMGDEEIIERLTVIRGIGRWTVEMLLIFGLGRPDVLPVSDYGVRKGYARAFGRRELPTPAQLLRRGERWRPYRSVASWYLWRAAENKELA